MSNLVIRDPDAIDKARPFTRAQLVQALTEFSHFVGDAYYDEWIGKHTANDPFEFIDVCMEVFKDAKPNNSEDFY